MTEDLWALDDGARSTDTQVWSNLDRIQTIPLALASLPDVPVLLLNQSNMHSPSCYANEFNLLFDSWTIGTFRF